MLVVEEGEGKIHCVEGLYPLNDQGTDNLGKSERLGQLQGALRPPGDPAHTLVLLYK